MTVVTGLHLGTMGSGHCILANRMINGVINIALSSSSRVTSHLPSRSALGAGIRMLGLTSWLCRQSTPGQSMPAAKF